MSNILFVKTSSLGDVIHHMPAVTDARRHLPGAHFSWVVEEDFASLVRLHPAVDDVIPVASRRWRRAPFARATWREITSFMRTVRARPYEEIIDTQGLLRSALMVRKARGRRHGYDHDSIREPLACGFYDIRYPVSRDLHAILRNRTLTGFALGYTPDATIDYGLPREKFGRAGRYGLLLHATARPEKLWPLDSWIALGNALQAHGMRLVLPWGTPAERQRGELIASSVSGAELSDRQPLDAMAKLVAGAAFVIGVDTGLVHLAAAFGVPLVAIFVSTNPGLTGPMGPGPNAIVGGKGSMPSVGEVMDAFGRVVAKTE
jgi:heptosyltransferase-1